MERVLVLLVQGHEDEYRPTVWPHRCTLQGGEHGHAMGTAATASLDAIHNSATIAATAAVDAAVVATSRPYPKRIAHGVML